MLMILIRNINIFTIISTRPPILDDAMTYACGEDMVWEINNSTGYILSPYYLIPDNYPANLSCMWLIEADAGCTIDLTFLTFDVQKK